MNYQSPRANLENSIHSTPVQTLQLTGGLGNQMFQYIAMKALQKNIGFKLRLDGRTVKRVSGNLPDLFAFVLDEEIHTKINLFTKTTESIDRLFWKSGLSRDVTGKYQSEHLGFDRLEILSNRGYKVRGFFQTLHYCQLLPKLELMRYFTLKKESPIFQDMKSKIDSKNSVALHIRRGDYRNYSNDFGMLGVNYYEDAITKIQGQYVDPVIWVFSDEEQEARLILKKFQDENLHFVDASILSAPETLVLMASCQALVIANSTFSWWAAYLSNSEKVIAPRPWYKRESEWLYADNLIPTHWDLQDATWE